MSLKPPKHPKVIAPSRRPPLPPIATTLVNQPLDVDTFVYVFRSFDAAASRRMPSELGSRVDHPKNGVYLTDVPINRGMVAAFQELKSMKVPRLQRMAYVWRVMDAAQLFDHVDRLDGLVERSLGRDELVLSEAIVKALAVASYDLQGGDAKLNIDSLVQHARRFKDQEVGKGPQIEVNVLELVPSAPLRNRATD